MKGTPQMVNCSELKYKHYTKFAKSCPPAFILLILFTCWLFTLTIDITNAFFVHVNIPQTIDGSITSIYYNSSTDLVKFRVEYQNRGSIPYTVRIRIDVLNVSTSDESRIIFTAWGPENIFMPGDKKTSDLYWYTNEIGNFTIRVRSYYANEILEKFFELEKKESIELSSNTSSDVFNISEKVDIFKINNFRVYDDCIIFDLFVEKDVKDIIIIPDSFTKGWIFEQKKIDLIKKGTTKTVILPYKPTVFTEDELVLKIVSENSGAYYKKTFTLTKNRGFLSFIYYVIDRIKISLAEN